MTIPLDMMTLGAFLLLGNNPYGCPEEITKVYSSVISDKYLNKFRLIQQYFPKPQYFS
jgi:hypothetical protein